MIVREKNDLGQWFKFFLVEIIGTAKKGINTFDNILQLQKQIDKDIQALRSRNVTVKKVMDFLYKRPLVDISTVSKIAQVSIRTAYDLIAELKKTEHIKRNYTKVKK